ncbi:MAG: FAD-dependent oxidoreductase [Pseudomonadales bacterium]|jgi:succinate dehydrogenase/fumarate reductase flavoprotein subunit|nr:FAD-dependent oxidoreductase [Gammaproteobacteria bacterium]MBP6053697.1 FAD-dependent oxidoreductase [Pseudomonadales bacterium]MBK6584299.1 FAD-dependent oxidoreductase [Gammaproteobacteria bacterium]MBK7168457.1 FAD-dependent oxidoreductase [Gammaproteobacteria bacterium]MBK7520482.1 FAD-dependent oxidoreductase [Gammaproteobacteria bacterium]
MKRRAFIAGVTATAAAAPLTRASSPAPESFDREVDVVVVGSGTGLCAALRAASAGLDVLVLEKLDTPGGTTLVSGGVLWIPNNTIQRREGLSDSREDSLIYLKKLSRDQATEELMTAFVDQGPRMLEFIESASDIRWRVSTLLGKVADYHPEWDGSNVRGRSVEPVQARGGMAGGVLIAALMKACQQAGVTVLTSSPARRLIAEHTADGTRVLGVEASIGDKPVRIRARRGVLIASGGFERNREMKTHFLRGPSPYTWGAEGNIGDGIHMAMALGSDLRNMNEVWHQVAYREDAERNGHLRGGISLSAQIERRFAGGICVNRYGERFANEAAAYDVTWQSFHTWENWGDLGYRNIPAFAIFDSSVRNNSTIAGKSASEPLPDWVVTAGTLPDLARSMNIDPKGLTTTVERFNHYARQGIDPDFHRGESAYDRHGEINPSATLAPVAVAPFYAAEVTPADLGTCGGVRVNGRAEVIDVFNRPIRNLYASGNTAGIGAPGALYGGGGGTLGPAFTFAFIAGEQIIKRQPSEPV